MFRSHSDHLQGAHIFLIKVTGFKICQKCKKLVRWCGSITYGVCVCVLYLERYAGLKLEKYELAFTISIDEIKYEYSYNEFVKPSWFFLTLTFLTQRFAELGWTNYSTQCHTSEIQCQKKKNLLQPGIFLPASKGIREERMWVIKTAAARDIHICLQ